MNMTSLVRRQTADKAGVLLILMTVIISVADCLQCMCSTDECEKSHKTICTAINTCYVQVTFDSVNDVIAGSIQNNHVKTVRGCIDEAMPLLCENRRPKGYSRPWPVLHCCTDNWCNKDILPTDPPWLLEDKRKIEEKKNHIDYEEIENDSHDVDSDDYDSSHHGNDNSRRHLNVLYIAAPLAGTCVVLALVIFTLYLMKMNRRSAKNCVKTKQLHHISSIYKQKLPLMIEARDQPRVYSCAHAHHAGVQSQNISTVTCETNAHKSNFRYVGNCDRFEKSREQCESSSGSETKLLV